MRNSWFSSCWKMVQHPSHTHTTSDYRLSFHSLWATSGRLCSLLHSYAQIVDKFTICAYTCSYVSHLNKCPIKFSLYNEVIMSSWNLNIKIWPRFKSTYYLLYDTIALEGHSNRPIISDSLSNQFLGLWNPEVQFCTHKDSPRIPILGRINPIPSIDTYFFKIYSNIVLSSTPTPS